MSTLRRFIALAGRTDDERLAIVQAVLSITKQAAPRTEKWWSERGALFIDDSDGHLSYCNHADIDRYRRMKDEYVEVFPELKVTYDVVIPEGPVKTIVQGGYLYILKGAAP